jgi:carboxypeptidase family protein
VDLKRRMVTAFATLLLVGGCLPATLDAQVLYGSIVGTVRDSSGAAVPGATVTITNKGTAHERTAVTSAEGVYSFTNVQAGQYDVKASLQGFKEFVKSNVPVNVNEVSRVDVALEVGALTETVTVASAQELLQTDKADTHTEIKSQTITELPLTQNRNYQSLINLVPGATPAGQQNSEVDTPGRALTTNVNGMDRNNNGTRTDGAQNINIWLPHHTMYVSPAETIDTVNVSTSNFDAEQGNAGGAAITVLTKSGTNNLHGSAFAFYNNQNLNAKPYFATEKPKASSHIDGVTLGGPIVKNKLFFFGAWEGQYQRTPQQLFYNVPPAALRAGDFSHAFNSDGSLQVIYDPRTGDPATGVGRVPFAGNIIPAELIDPIAKEIQALYPDTNLPGDGGANVGGQGVFRNYVRQQDRSFDRNNYDFKVNYNLSAASQIWGKYSRMGADVTSPQHGLGYDGQLTGQTTVQMATFGDTWTISPTMVFDATFAFAKMTHHSTEPDSASKGNFGLDTLGIPGMNGGANFSSDPRYAGIPAISPFGCCTNWGSTGIWDTIGTINTWDPVERDERTYSLAGNLTKLAGAHEYRFGYSVNKLRMNHWQPELGYGPRGWMQGAANATSSSQDDQSANIYNGYAAFLLSRMDVAGTSVQNELMTTREWQHNFYARDRWQVNNKLTLDLGLRYEYYPLMKRADRGIEKILGANDLASTRDLANHPELLTPDASGALRPTVLLGGKGDIPDDIGIKVSKALFAPRLGAVYRINDNNVFRVGYGITYNPLPFSRPLRGQYPLTLASAYYADDTYGWATTFEQGIPDIVAPDESTGRLALNPDYLIRTPAADVSRGRIQSWNVSYERRLFYDISVDLAYVGTAKNDGLNDIDANASDVPGGGNASRPLRSIRGNSSLILWGPLTKSRYNSLQVAINRPFKGGLMLKGAYTLSKAKNEADDDGWEQVRYNAPSTFSRNYALAGYDRTHMFQMAFVYELPYKTSTSKDVAHLILGDWQVNGIYSAVSGTPFTITADGTDLNMPGTPQTANQNGDYKIIGGHAGEPFFDASSFSQPHGVVLGDTGRNQFRGPGYQNMDFSIFRAFPIGGSGKRVEFRTEFFNLTNTPKWTNPDGDVNSSNFGHTYGVGDSSRDAGSGERQIRIGLRFQF